ncbi:MAG: MarR family transcriptional regulator [Solirubrobacteraceae bacterium]
MSTRAQQRREKLIDELSRRTGRDLATKTVLFHHALAARLGLGVTDLKCLDLLRQTNAPLTPGNLVALTGLTGGAITGVADRLEAAGFVERVRDPNDRRRWELRPRPDRQHELATLFAPLGQAMSELSARYTDEQLLAISDFLTRLGTIVDNQTERLRATTEARPVCPGPSAMPAVHAGGKDE